MSLSSISIELFSAPVQGNDTIVVMGAPYGGTSMVASTCDLLGIPMGMDRDEHIDPSATDAALMQSATEFVQSQNTAFKTWGWKNPISSHSVWDSFDHLISPRFICIYQDPVVIASNEIIEQKLDQDAMQAAAPTIMYHVIEQHLDMMSLITEKVVPTLMISHDRAMKNPEEVIQIVSQFIGRDLPADAEAQEKLVSKIAQEYQTSHMGSFAQDKQNAENAMAEFGNAYSSEKATDYKAALGRQFSILSQMDPKEKSNFTIAFIKTKLRKMDSLEREQKFDEALELGYKLIAIIASEYSDLKKHPIELIVNGFNSFSENWPRSILRIWFKMGMCLLQNGGDTKLASCLFQVTIKYCELHPNILKSKAVPIHFWANLYHYGYAAKISGFNDEAKMAGLRITAGNAYGLAVDQIAHEFEPGEYEIFLERAKKTLL